MKIIFASRNRSKYCEMKEAFAPVGIELLFGAEFYDIEVNETGESYEENALLKARAWSEATGLPAIADDSGLEVEALNGEPGVNSARIVSGSDKERVSWLLKSMEDVENRKAKFVSCLAVVFPDSDTPLICQKSCEGVLTKDSVGSSGFGYDPIFVPLGYDKTFAELGDSIKTKISHRALSIKGIVEMLKPVLQYYTVRVLENSQLERGHNPA